MESSIIEKKFIQLLDSLSENFDVFTYFDARGNRHGTANIIFNHYRRNNSGLYITEWKKRKEVWLRIRRGNIINNKHGIKLWIKGDFTSFYDGTNRRTYLKQLDLPIGSDNIISHLWKGEILEVSILNKELEQFDFNENYFIELLQYSYNSYVSNLISELSSNSLFYQEEISFFNQILANEDDYKNNVNTHPLLLDETEKELLVKVRSQQGKFKNNLLKLYLDKDDEPCCKMCGMRILKLLIASHIKSWNNSDAFERTDPYNGLLLCPTHDSLFDKKLISFDQNGLILISNSIPLNQYRLLNLEKSFVLAGSSFKSKKYLKWHREVFQLNEESK